MAGISLYFDRSRLDTDDAGTKDEEPILDLNGCLVEGVSVDSADGYIDLADSKNISDAKLIALGESTHGSKEMILWRFYFSKYLVEKEGFNMLGLEITYPEAEALNSYVTGFDQRDPRIVLKSLHYPLLLNVEMIHLLDWIKAHNTISENEVRIFGIDIPFSTLPPENISRYLSRVNPGIGRFADSVFSTIRTKGMLATAIGNRYRLSDSAIEMKIGLVKAVVKRYEGKLVANSSIEEFNDCLHNIDLINLAVTRIGAQKEGPLAFANYRDSSMYANIKWAMDVKWTENSKAIIWAHNEHIRKASPKGRKPLGHFLGKWLKERFYSLGSDFGYGDYTYNSPQGIRFGYAMALKNVFYRYHQKARRQIYFFNFRSEGGAMPNAKTYLHNIPASASTPIYDVVDLNNMFDGFVYIPKSSAPDFFPGG